MTEVAESDLWARDSYRSTAALTILIGIWLVVVTLFGLPFSRTYYAVRLAVAVAGFMALAYLAGTWRRPRPHVAVVIQMMEALSVASLIAWSGWLGANLGERWQPIAAAQLAIAGVPLVTPLAWVGYLLVAGFTGELLLVLAYQQHMGLGPLPAGEPFAALSITVVSVAVLVLREQRRRRTLAVIRLRAEGATLSRLAPVFSSIHAELDKELDVLGAVAPSVDGRTSAFSRSVERLGALSDKLDSLSRGPREWGELEERLALARDSHTGAFIFAITGVVVASLSAWGTRGLPLAHTSSLLWCLGLAYTVIAGWLWSTRGHPTLGRSVLIGVALVVLAELVASYAHSYWLRMSLPAFPFIGHKVLLLCMVLFRMPRLWIGAALLASMAIVEVVMTLFIAGQLPLLELWHTVVFALIGLGFLVMGEERRISSLDLLHTEAQVLSLRRRAKLSLAVCDQLNTPLQILTTIIDTRPVSAATAEASAHIDRLAMRSHELSALVEELPPHLREPSFDATVELRHKVWT